MCEYNTIEENNEGDKMDYNNEDECWVYAAPSDEDGRLDSDKNCDDMELGCE